MSADSSDRNHRLARTPANCPWTRRRRRYQGGCSSL